MLAVDRGLRPEAGPLRWRLSIIGLYKSEIIARRGPWRHCEAVELATLEWVHWYNHRRLLEPLGHLPPAQFEAHHYHQLQESTMAA